MPWFVSWRILGRGLVWYYGVKREGEARCVPWPLASIGSCLVW